MTHGNKIAFFREEVFQLGQPFVAEIIGDKGDVAGLACLQAAGQLIREISQGLDGLQYRLAFFSADELGIIQHI